GMGIEIKMGEVYEGAVFDLSGLKDIFKDLSESLRLGPDEDYNGEKLTNEQQLETDIKARISSLKRDIDKYAAKYCATDRGAMAVIMDAVRNGEELLGGRDEHYGQDKVMTWFVAGYQPLPDNRRLINKNT
ncbi:MAG: hypothetical protein K2H23_02975, partial [Oscillospiraceae bacterium]|nr:hypothetical protein [Oscillospiraceae bacterium]